MSRMSVAEVRALATQRQAARATAETQKPPRKSAFARSLPKRLREEGLPEAVAPAARNVAADMSALNVMLKRASGFRTKVLLLHTALGLSLGAGVGFAVGLDPVISAALALLGGLAGAFAAKSLSRRAAPVHKPVKLATKRGARLYALIEQIARRMEIPAPRTVLLTADSYIWLDPTTNPQRQPLQIGLPLLEVLSVDALSALIARALHRSREVAQSPFRNVFSDVAATEAMALALARRSRLLSFGLASKAETIAEDLRRAASPILRGIDRAADTVSLTITNNGDLADGIIAQTVIRHIFAEMEGASLGDKLTRLRRGIEDETVDAAIRLALTCNHSEAGFSHQPLRERLERLDPNHQPAPVPNDPTASVELMDDDAIVFLEEMEKSGSRKKGKEKAKAPAKGKKRAAGREGNATPALAPSLFDALSEADERASMGQMEAIEAYGALLQANPEWDTVRLRLALALLDAGDARGIAVAKQVANRQPAASAIIVEAIEAFLDTPDAAGLDLLQEKRELLAYKDIAEKAAMERTTFDVSELEPLPATPELVSALADILTPFPEITEGWVFDCPVTIVPERAHCVLVLHAPALPRGRAAEIGAYIAERLVLDQTVAVHIECGRMNAALEPLVAKAEPLFGSQA